MNFLVVKGNYNNIAEVPVGGMDKIIVRDLKTLKGVINRFKKWYPFKECTIFSFNDFYNNDTFELQYHGIKD
jgi:hypothetical protein